MEVLNNTSLPTQTEENRLMDLAGGGGGKGWDNGERNTETNITIYKRDSQREFAA